MRSRGLLIALLAVTANADFDYIEYAEQWLPALCQVSNEKSSGSCSYPICVKGWTTHGVWPDYDNGGYPSYCSGPAFNASQLTPIQSQLDCTWPDAVSSDSDDDFWSHEWTKHGTCCSNDPRLAGELNYFNSSITLNTYFDLYNQLNSNGFKTSTTYWYTQSQVQAALKQVFGNYNVIYLCVTDESNGKEYLSSVRACITDDYPPVMRDCSSSTREKRSTHPAILSNDLPSPTACKTDKIYYLPLGNSQPVQATFDFITYAEVWEPAYCLVSNERTPGSCSYPSNITGWATHGVWPDNSDGSYPSFCGGSFDPNQIQPLLPQLTNTWPNIVVGDDDDDFWSHEWDKHGTCCTSVPMYSGEYNYFSSSILLNQQANLYNQLASQGIVTSTTATYTQAQIRAALTNIFGVIVEMMCVKDSSHNEYLSDIRLCIDKNDNTKYIDCPKDYFFTLSKVGAQLNSLPDPNQCSTNVIHYVPL